MMSHAVMSAGAGDLTAAAFAILVATWMGMMTGMMAPVAWPWVVALRGILLPDAGALARLGATLSFASGYLTAWLVYAIAAAGLQLMLEVAGVLDQYSGMPGTGGAAILIGAGVFQLTPLKRACLAHCRNPLSFLLTRWRTGPPSGYRVGIAHGVYCVSCCWALMGTMLAVGMTNLVWMAALTAAVVVEQAVPRGDRIRVPMGLALIAAGAMHIV
jgi:predicted metal-binding membrane protein